MNLVSLELQKSLTMTTRESTSNGRLQPVMVELPLRNILSRRKTNTSPIGRRPVRFQVMLWRLA